MFVKNLKKNVLKKFLKTFEDFSWPCIQAETFKELFSRHFLPKTPHSLPHYPAFQLFSQSSKENKFKLCRNFVNRPLAKYPQKHPLFIKLSYILTAKKKKLLRRRVHKFSLQNSKSIFCFSSASHGKKSKDEKDGRFFWPFCSFSLLQFAMNFCDFCQTYRIQRQRMIKYQPQRN